MQINVLSIDGGGIRGIIPAAILEAVEAGTKRPVAETFDLIAGTSTGGIIALGVGTTAKNGVPYTPAELLQMYVGNGPKIFPRGFFTGAKALLGPKYSAAPLEAVLQQFFGDTLLSTARTPLLISSYDLQGQQPFFFKSHGIASHPTWDGFVRDAARATSAAPTFFPPFHYVAADGDYALVDGGIYANNPAMAAFAEAQRLYPEADSYVVVAAGTGDRHDRITFAQAKGWGLIGWARQIVPVIMDSVSEAVDYELTSLSGRKCKFYRFQPVLRMASPQMDDVSPENLDLLQKEASNWIAQNRDEIAQLCAAVGGGRGSNLPGTGRAAPLGPVVTKP